MLDQGLHCFGHLAKKHFLERILVLEKNAFLRWEKLPPYKGFCGEKTFLLENNFLWNFFPAKKNSGWKKLVGCGWQSVDAAGTALVLWSEENCDGEEKDVEYSNYWVR